MDIHYLADIGLDVISPSRATFPHNATHVATCQDDMTLAALMPDHPVFDEEAIAAANVLPVLRFVFDEHAVITKKEGRRLTFPCRAILRGFMLSGERWRLLYKNLVELGIHLVITPDEYERAHYFPNAYGALSPFSPRATWVAVDIAALTSDVFDEAFAEIRSWGCQYVMLKDFVKSAKANSERFSKVGIDENLADVAIDLVHIRGRRFNRGVVFKEWVDLRHYATRSGYVPNEWRLWFGKGKLLTMLPNSFQEESASSVPRETVDMACRAAHDIGSPYMTIDVAETIDGWIALEAGDGGVSGPAPGQDLFELWHDLTQCFK